MDLDAFVAVHQADWQRLDALSRQRRPSGAESDEIVRLYRRAAADLSRLQSSAPEPTIIGKLSAIVARARGSITGSSALTWPAVVWFFIGTLPAAFYRVRWWTLGAAFGSILLATIVGTYIVQTPEAHELLGTPESIRSYVEHDFVGYYSENPNHSFASSVWINNSFVAAQCIALGITGIGVINVLFQNAVGVGMAGGLMTAYGHPGNFWFSILPHGLLELTAIFVAAGAGLALFWAWVSPGNRTRANALATEGRTMITVALGLVGVLGVSGLIEGFVTPSQAPVWLKLLIGAGALVTFLVYMLVLGRRATLARETGDLSWDLQVETDPVEQ